MSEFNWCANANANAQKRRKLWADSKKTVSSSSISKKYDALKRSRYKCHINLIQLKYSNHKKFRTRNKTNKNTQIPTHYKWVHSSWILTKSTHFNSIVWENVYLCTMYVHVWHSSRAHTWFWILVVAFHISHFLTPISNYIVDR